MPPLVQNLLLALSLASIPTLTVTAVFSGLFVAGEARRTARVVRLRCLSTAALFAVVTLVYPAALARQPTARPGAAAQLRLAPAHG